MLLRRDCMTHRLIAYYSELSCLFYAEVRHTLYKSGAVWLKCIEVCQSFLNLCQSFRIAKTSALPADEKSARLPCVQDSDGRLATSALLTEADVEQNATGSLVLGGSFGIVSFDWHYKTPKNCKI